MSLPARILVVLLMIACCGCGLSSSTLSVSYQVSSTSFQPGAEMPTRTSDSPPLQFVGRNSCSATACHGQPQAEPVSWRNAYPLWETADPHRRAFDVLYTERSVQMFRKLTETTATAIDDKAYLRFVEEKCIGCHATPPAGSLVGSKLQLPTNPDAYWQGVSCESCHGLASNWLGQHYSLSWPETGDPLRATRTAEMGFRDTRSLEQRAETCLKCHQGPQQIGDQLYDVNHDLIAAGHPRLQFELHAYLANLPKHWDEEAEIVRHEKARPPQASKFHFETWRTGQIQQMKQSLRLQQARAGLAANSDAGEWTEFANKDCRLCHHSFGDVSYRAAFTNQPSLYREELSRHSASNIKASASLVQQLIGNSHTSDQAIDLYLAAAAFAHDLPQGTLAAELAQLQQAIAQQSGASQYDLRGKFNPQQPELQQALLSLQQALQQLAQ